jgi:hypothetical protein
LLESSIRSGRNLRWRALGIEFTLTTSNQEVAFQIGTVRELVSRNLSRLQAAGLPKLNGKKGCHA